VIDSTNEGVNDENPLAANHAEIDNALDTINRIANNTKLGVKSCPTVKQGSTEFLLTTI